MRYVCSNTLSVFLLFLFVACGSQDRELNSLPNPSNASVAIIAMSEYPSVVKVIGPGGSGLCTGTFVSPRAVLTAAHCTQTSGTYTIQSAFGQFQTSTVRNLSNGLLEDPNDVSLLIFASDVADRNQGQVSDMADSVASGDTVRLVGFGCTDLDTRTGAGVKRTGTNEIFDVRDYVELYSPLSSSSGSGIRGIIGSSNRAGSCFGDSGGPALIAQNGQLKVAAIAHAGGHNGSVALSEYVNIATNNTNRNFLYQESNNYSLDIRGL